MASKAGQPEADKVDIEEALDYVDKTLDRTKVLYEQYFLGMQKQPPTQIHTDVERRLRDLQQLAIRNTGLRYRFATLQQKFGSYNSYWRRTLKQIENGTYIRNLQKISRKAALTGEAIPEEILAAMPKRMREQVKRDREQALQIAKRRNEARGDDSMDVSFDDEDDGAAAMIGESPEVVRQIPRGGAHTLDAGDGDLDFEAFFASVDKADDTQETAPAYVDPTPVAPARAAAPPPVRPSRPVVQYDIDEDEATTFQAPPGPAPRATGPVPMQTRGTGSVPSAPPQGGPQHPRAATPVPVAAGPQQPRAATPPMQGGPQHPAAATPAAARPQQPHAATGPQHPRGATQPGAGGPQYPRGATEPDAPPPPPPARAGTPPPVPPQRASGSMTALGAQPPQRASGAIPAQPGQPPQRASGAIPAQPGQPRASGAIPAEPGQPPQRASGAIPPQPGQPRASGAIPAEPGQPPQRASGAIPAQRPVSAITTQRIEAMPGQAPTQRIETVSSQAQTQRIEAVRDLPSTSSSQRTTESVPSLQDPPVQRATGPVPVQRATGPVPVQRATGPVPVVPAPAGSRMATGPVPVVPPPAGSRMATGPVPVVPPPAGSRMATPPGGVKVAVPVIPIPAVPSIPRPNIPSGGVPRPGGAPAPSQISKPNPIAPGSSTARAAVPVETMSGPFPRAAAPPVNPRQAPPKVAPPKPQPPAPRPPPGMSDADVNALHATYVKAKQAVGEEAGPGSYGKLLQTINAQAPKIMEQYKAKGVEFSVVVKDNQVVIKAKPKT